MDTSRRTCISSIEIFDIYLATKKEKIVYIRFFEQKKIKELEKSLIDPPPFSVNRLKLS